MSTPQLKVTKLERRDSAEVAELKALAAKGLKPTDVEKVDEGYRLRRDLSASVVHEPVDYAKAEFYDEEAGGWRQFTEEELKDYLVAEGDDPFMPTLNETRLINRHTLKDFPRDELWAVTNEGAANAIDRGFERFTVKALRKLAQKYREGRPGLRDHNSRDVMGAELRTFNAMVMRDATRPAHNDEPYTWLKLRKYTVRADWNKEVRERIESGLMKETSVGFFVNLKDINCSVCGEQMYGYSSMFSMGGGCDHMPGEMYDGQLCFGEIVDVEDAAEDSFVAVPQQPNAGTRRGKSHIPDGRHAPEQEDTMTEFKDALAFIKEHEMSDDERTELMTLLGVPVAEPDALNKSHFDQNIEQAKSDLCERLNEFKDGLAAKEQIDAYHKAITEALVAMQATQLEEMAQIREQISAQKESTDAELKALTEKLESPLGDPQSQPFTHGLPDYSQYDDSGPMTVSESIQSKLTQPMPELS